jgi:hypothetical protein
MKISSGIALLALLVTANAAMAQSGIAGNVKDTTGAVLPGVTVQASSPALIEKVRVVVTDDQGQYKIVDLRPGTYTVTFSLPGFVEVRREGIELSASFTATVNGELRLGGLEETITVSGASPLVDVQNVVQNRVVTAQLIAAIPTARTYQNFAQMIPGTSIVNASRPAGQDVGGLSGERQRVQIHGSRANDFSQTVDGLSGFNVLNNAGSTTSVTINPAEVQEFSYDLGAISADTEKGGVHVNVIPKEGGNRFAGMVFGAFANSSMQADNMTDDLRARGLRSGNPLDKIWDINPGFGGPLRENKLWFYGSFRQNTLNTRVAGMYHNATPTGFKYTPDLDRPAVDDLWIRSTGVRLTWQAAPKHKVSFFGLQQAQCQCHYLIGSVLKTPEASSVQEFPKARILTSTWSSPFTNRLLFEAGALINRFRQDIGPRPEVAPGTVAATELSTGLQFRAAPSYTYTTHRIETYRAALSYVTGSHATKVGMSLVRGERNSTVEVNGNHNIALLNGVPRSVTVYATPYVNIEHLNANFGLYAQDQWTIKRLTANIGLRFDYLHTSVPEQHLPAVQFMPARDFNAVADVPNWKDLSPRFGASYDLFGTGKTALKVSLSRYVLGELVDFAQSNNPVIASVNSTTRTWTDLNGNFVPDCNLGSATTNGECGPLASASFGKPNIVTRYDDAIKSGFGVRGYNWEASAGVQHEVIAGLSASAMYFRRSYGNFTVTDNLAVAPADYNPYCITAPRDSRLPDGGGYQVCGLYDINPSKFGQVNNLVTKADAYGAQREVYNGLDVNVNARMRGGVMLQGGLNVGRTQTTNCNVVDSPQQLRFCDINLPFQSQFKIFGTYPLPWHLQAGGSFQSTPGPQILANYVATSAQIMPSLGRNLSAGANGTATIPLVQPGTLYGERMYQVDARLTRIFKVGRSRIQGNFDLYNALNASPVLVQNSTFGAEWQRPTYILPGRLFKVSVQVEF